VQPLLKWLAQEIIRFLSGKLGDILERHDTFDPYSSGKQWASVATRLTMRWNFALE
jgi:hypothetical protein